MAPRYIVLTAVSGFLAVLFGAMGAHALRATLTERASNEAWQTASQYHLAHALACLALIAWASTQPAREKRLQRIAALWLLGCLLFSGSIYALALGGPRFLGPVTPLGGLALLTGWSLLAWEATKKPQTRLTST